MRDDERIIVIENNKSSDEDFTFLMRRTDAALNRYAAEHNSYFIGRNGTDLEIDVVEALKDCAKNTVFDGTISLVSGASFPDIVANKYYGVEVKSTKDNKWKSIGSSILESTRIKDIKKIYLTFGKLGSPVRFLSRPYEECLYDISITHYPRYQIDMRLKKGETIFDKMGIDYETLRKLEDPVKPVSAYYKSLLKPGQSLWWAGGAKEIEQTNLVPFISLWASLPPEKQTELLVKGYVYFPEMLAQGKGLQSKYNRFSLWLASNGVVCPNVRDAFSAGGQKDVSTFNRVFVKMPAVFKRVYDNREAIFRELKNTPPETLMEYWEVSSINDPIDKWCKIAAEKAVNAALSYEKAYDCLSSILYTVD